MTSFKQLEERVKILEGEISCKRLEKKINILENEIKHLKAALQYQLRNKKK
tara:strand:- start:195 stop:347 length:153 start_codon:yes stop_codon:yes gene_type:complete